MKGKQLETGNPVTGWLLKI